MKVFLSIGTGPGIGLATAGRFCAEGFTTVLCSRNSERLEPYAQQFRKLGQVSEVKHVDATETQNIQSLITEVVRQYGAIDVLHYNAAALRHSTLSDQPAETFLADLAVNIAGAMVAVQTVSPSMFAKRNGTVLLTGGKFAVKPSSDYLSLSIGKAGIRAMTLGLFDTFKSQGVHIATVTVSATNSSDLLWSAGVAETFWRLHNTPPDEWQPEALYPDSALQI